VYAYTVNNGGLQYVQKPEPTPEPGQVSITVHTAGLGLIDALWTIGAMPSNPDFVPGLEVSGTVRALGEGVNHLAEGQLVAAILPAAGGFAEVVCTPATLVAPIPQKLDHDLAAVVPINTVTAHLALTTVARLADCGVPVELGPVDRAGALGPVRSLYVRDPDRNLVELAFYDGA